MIGFTGAHRTGKSTAAKVIAETYDIEYVQLPRVLDSMGLEPKDITTMDLRLDVQERLTEACADVFLKRKGMFVSDRTPLDVLAYTLAEGNQGLTERQQMRLMDIHDTCMHLAESCFSQFAYFKPTIPYVAEPGKPLPNLAYQRHIDAIILGLLMDSDITHGFYVVEKINHDDRINHLRHMVESVFENAEKSAGSIGFDT